MRVAVVGSGISGLAAAHLLSRRHEVHVFESADRLGGHTYTVRVDDDGRDVDVDMGFIVFNELTYPNLCQLFEQLGIASRPSEMSFSVHCENTGLEYNATRLRTLFAQRRNLVRPAFWRMLRDILRFHRDAYRALDAGLDETITIARFVERHAYGPWFFSHYLQPMGAAIWSCPADRFARFPALFVLRFMANHRLLQVEERPIWRTVCGGSKTYIEPLTRAFASRIHCRSPIRAVWREANAVGIETASAHREHFDHVVIAAHADEALRMLIDAEPFERECLGSFAYQDNEAVLHTDTRVLPDRPAAWAAWNYRLEATAQARATLTYNMNALQGLESHHTYCVTLNQTGRIAPSSIRHRVVFRHPSFLPGVSAAQALHEQMIDRRGVSFCGAYWGNGFHEDGLNSALRVCAAFDLDLASERGA